MTTMQGEMIEVAVIGPLDDEDAVRVAAIAAASQAADQRGMVLRGGIEFVRTDTVTIEGLSFQTQVFRVATETSA